MEKSRESMVNDLVYGKNIVEFWGKLDLSTYSLKTAQCLLFEDLSECFAIFPKAGMIANGNVYRQRNLDSTIEGSESMVLPTPAKSDAKIILRYSYQYKKYYERGHQDKTLYQCHLNGLTANQTMNVYEWMMGFPMN